MGKEPYFLCTEIRLAYQIQATAEGGTFLITFPAVEIHVFGCKRCFSVIRGLLGPSENHKTTATRFPACG
jgi:hypothetical protein